MWLSQEGNLWDGEQQGKHFYQITNKTLIGDGEIISSYSPRAAKQICGRKTRSGISFQFSSPILHFLDHTIFCLGQNRPTNQMRSSSEMSCGTDILILAHRLPYPGRLWDCIYRGQRKVLPINSVKWQNLNSCNCLKTYHMQDILLALLPGPGPADKLPWHKKNQAVLSCVRRVDAPRGQPGIPVCPTLGCALLQLMAHFSRE